MIHNSTARQILLGCNGHLGWNRAVLQMDQGPICRQLDLVLSWIHLIASRSRLFFHDKSFANHADRIFRREGDAQTVRRKFLRGNGSIFCSDGVDRSRNWGQGELIHLDDFDPIGRICDNRA